MGFSIIDLPCNLGIGGAVQTGYKYALKNEYSSD
jgi:GT2 family glycosyltransferase